MNQNNEPKDAFQIMESNLLPVFKEAVSITKEISADPNWFKENYKASRRLYAMAMVSLAIKSVTGSNISDEQKKKNIERICLNEERHFYKSDGSLGKKENIFKRPEIEAFKSEMRNLNAEYFDDAVIQECLGNFEADAAVGMWNDNQPIISADGKIFDWKRAVKSDVFQFAVKDFKDNMLVSKMNEASKENKWDKREWNKNYPIVNRECDKIIEPEIAKHCQNKQNILPLGLSKTR